MFYIDTSALLKLLWAEPESDVVRSYVAREDLVVVSILTEVEADNRLRAAWLAGRYGAPTWRRLRSKFNELSMTPPFTFRALPASFLETARRQQAASGRVHCRTLDRLHLAAMEELELHRLLTNDRGQAAAARALGFEVLNV